MTLITCMSTKTIVQSHLHQLHDLHAFYLPILYDKSSISLLSLQNTTLQITLVEVSQSVQREPEIT